MVTKKQLIKEIKELKENFETLIGILEKKDETIYRELNHLFGYTGYIECEKHKFKNYQEAIVGSITELKENLDKTNKNINDMNNRTQPDYQTQIDNLKKEIKALNDVLKIFAEINMANDVMDFLQLFGKKTEPKKKATKKATTTKKKGAK